MQPASAPSQPQRDSQLHGAGIAARIPLQPQVQLAPGQLVQVQAVFVAFMVVLS